MSYCEEEYIRAKRANLNERIKKLQNNIKDNNIFKIEDDKYLKNKIIDYCNEICLVSLDPNYLKNTHSKWKNNSKAYKFTSVFENNKTISNEPFLREVIYYNFIIPMKIQKIN